MIKNYKLITCAKVMKKELGKIIFASLKVLFRRSVRRICVCETSCMHVSYMYVCMFVFCLHYTSILVVAYVARN